MNYYSIRTYIKVILILILNGIQCYKEEPYSLVVPEESTTKLKVSKEGIAYLRKIKCHVAPIIVIGPYRSGKSFLLNQLLNTSCDKGFGVGHLREAQTKGIWLWGQPIMHEKENYCYLYMDTEGFESAGKSNSYDDRIFAIAMIMSSLMIYNLPETVRESDLSKLAFSVELADVIFNNQDGKDNIKSGNMLWLIQRDFLEGKSVQENIERILTPVDNPKKDNDIESINKIRRSLAIVANNSIGYGLRQPHLDRTKLCEMADEVLDKEYVRQRNELRKIVKDSAGVKIVHGKKMNGNDMADLVIKVIEALNEREIPTASSIMTSFNKQLIDKYTLEFISKMDQLKLPIDEQILINTKNEIKEELIRKYNENKYGRRGEWIVETEELKREFEDTLERFFETAESNNKVKCKEICEKSKDKCENRIENLFKSDNNRIPSKYIFEYIYNACLEEFENECMGPTFYEDKIRLTRLLNRERTYYFKTYNDNLYYLLLMILIGITLTGYILSFVNIRFTFMFFCGILLIMYLFIYPKFFCSSFDDFYTTIIWERIVYMWEVIPKSIWTFTTGFDDFYKFLSIVMLKLSEIISNVLEMIIEHSLHFYSYLLNEIPKLMEIILEYSVRFIKSRHHFFNYICNMLLDIFEHLQNYFY